MQALHRHIQKLIQEGTHLARAGCALVDYVAQDVTPHRLHEVQERLRGVLVAVELEIHELDRKAARRDERIRCCNVNTPEFKRAYGQHKGLHKVRRNLLIDQRNMLRQIGDALAWLVLRNDQFVIRALYSQDNAHTPVANNDVGATGAMHVRRELHADGTLLVLDNDITRCLGSGDFTVVPAHGRWRRPTSVELKSHGKNEIGAEVNVEVRTLVSDLPDDQAVAQRIGQIIGSEPRPAPPLSAREQRQMDEMKRRAEMILEIDRYRPAVLPPAQRSSWDAMSDVLRKAYDEGEAVAVVESGIIFSAINVRTVIDAEAACIRIRDDMQRAGASQEYPYVSITSVELREEPLLSTYIPPVALWKLPFDLRVSLLAGDLFLACAYDPKIWQNAFEAANLNLRIENGRWYISNDHADVEFNEFEVRKLAMGVAMSGIIPDEVAARVADFLNEKSRDTLRT